MTTVANTTANWTTGLEQEQWLFDRLIASARRLPWSVETYGGETPHFAERVIAVTVPVALGIPASAGQIQFRQRLLSQGQRFDFQSACVSFCDTAHFPGLSVPHNISAPDIAATFDWAKDVAEACLVEVIKTLAANLVEWRASAVVEELWGDPAVDPTEAETSRSPFVCTTGGCPVHDPVFPVDAPSPRRCVAELTYRPNREVRA